MLQVLLFVAFLCSFSDVGDVYAFGENKMSQLGLGTQSPYVPSPTMVRTYSVIYKLPPANEVWGKVMFLHVSVHGEVCLQRKQGDLPTEVEGCLPKEGVGQTPTPGTRKVGGPTEGKGFRLWGEGWSAYRGGWADPPPRTRNAGGTHPTGMLSCYTKDFSHTKKNANAKHVVNHPWWVLCYLSY